MFLRTPEATTHMYTHKWGLRHFHRYLATCHNPKVKMLFCVLLLLCSSSSSSSSSSSPSSVSEHDVRAMYEQYPFPPLPVSQSHHIATRAIPRAGSGMTRKFVGPSHLVVSFRHSRGSFSWSSRVS